MDIWFKLKRIVIIFNSDAYSKEKKLLVRGILAYVIAYCVHSFFHNAGPFFRDVTHWMVLSMVFAVQEDKYDQYDSNLNEVSNLDNLAS